MLMQDIISNVKVYLPEIYASTIVAMVYMNIGVSLAYSAVLIPALKNGTDTIPLTPSEHLWIVNCVNLVIPCVCILPGFATDIFGRLWVLKMTLIAHVVGWATIALAKISTTIIIGRIITGFALAFQLGACSVYISEISSPNLRGPLLIIPTVTFTLGTFVTYLAGYFTSWRIVSWLSCAYGVVFISLLYTLPRSPFWLVSKNRIEDARKSLEWLKRFHTSDKVSQIVEQELTKIQDEQEANKSRSKTSSKWQEFILPTAYKPFIILTVVLILQQFSGSYVVVMNAVTFFDAIGTNADPYLSSTYMAVTRMFTTLIYVALAKHYGKRVLLMFSFLGMAVAMSVSGIYTYWIANDMTENSWVPICMLFLYYVFTAGVLGIPFSLSGELFPVSVRGIGSNVVFGMLYFFAFISVASYPYLLEALGGMDILQYFFGVVGFLGAAFTFLFVPETLNKRLSEIETHFWSHTFAIFNSKDNVEEEKKKVQIP